MAETLEQLGERPGWTITGQIATYQPQPEGWIARVTPDPSGRHYARWRIAIIDPHGKARYVCGASMLGEVIRQAEGRVRGATSADE